MKNFAILLGLLIAAGSTLAQQPTTTVQMRCRDFAPTGDALGPEETLVNGMACHADKASCGSGKRSSVGKQAPLSWTFRESPGACYGYDTCFGNVGKYEDCPRLKGLHCAYGRLRELPCGRAREEESPTSARCRPKAGRLRDHRHICGQESGMGKNCSYGKHPLR